MLMAELPEPPMPTLSAIYASYEARQGDGFRDHLGASLIGKSCARALWYDFRWATPARHTGRILRLFETGQLEEARLVRDLRATGATVLEVDPETGRQFRVEAHGGHFGGSLDAVALGLLEAPKTWHVVEFKTHSAKSFAELVAKGVANASLSTPRRCRSTCTLRASRGRSTSQVCKDTGRAAHRARPGRPRDGRTPAGEGAADHLRPAPARADQRGSRLVRVQVLRPPRALPRRGRRGCHLPVLPAFDAHRRRLALRAPRPAARPRQPAPRVPLAPVHPRSRSPAR